METYPPRTTSTDQTISPTRTTHLTYWLVRHWIIIFGLLMGLYVGLPFLAPLFMHWGWSLPAKGIYWIYTFLCHQLPQRSFFLFGPKTMYSLSEIQTLWQDTANPLILRQFIGLPETGWKVAWSDRMVYMYASTLIFGLLWWPLRRRIQPLPWWGLIALLFPMFIDGTTHFLSDLAGFGQGFRYTNLWLAELTNNALPANFYSGNLLGSFNSWMRLITGLLFGLGVVWFGFPYADQWFTETAHLMRTRTHLEANPRW